MVVEISVSPKVEQKKIDKFVAGEYFDDDVIFYNAGEAEVVRNFDYSTIKAKSFVEVTGRAEEVKIDNPAHRQYSYPLYWLADTICQNFQPDTATPPNPDIWEQPNPPKELFCAMVGQPRPHRQMVVDLLNWMGCTSSYIPQVHQGIFCDIIEDDVFMDGAYGRVTWNKFNSTATHRWPEFYENVLVDLVMETFCDRKFFTEKTWKPLLARKWPIVFGDRSTMFYLATRWDFRFPTEVMDMQWDHHPTPYIRAREMVKEIQKMQSQSVRYLDRISRQCRIHNQKRCFELLDEVTWDSSIPTFEIYEDTLQHAKYLRDYWWKKLDFPHPV